MKFGTFVFPVSHDPKNDSVVIDNALKEIELADALGFDTAWLTEHHFDGASAYVDPLVFGAAIASRTNRIRIGFAVAEMALHHPVRFAIQTSLLDNLSHGRLTVGVGRGSAYNHYEYIGFGVDMEESAERLAEAEDLILKAWTTKNFKYDGRFWKVAFPTLRPRPYQKPHPPLVRACISEASTIAMAKIGRPILMGAQEISTVERRLSAYRDAMLSSGYTEVETEHALDNNWVSKDLFVAESESEAREIAEAGFRRERKHFREAREVYNPGGFPPLDPSKPLPAGEDVNKSFIIGDPSQVADQLAELQNAGARNIMLKMNVGEMDTNEVQSSMKLFSQKVMPLFT